VVYALWIMFTETRCRTSLRVIIQALQGFADGCKTRIPRLVSFPRLYPRCTVLRSRWSQRVVLGAEPGV
jgi:hypothetical protein